MGERKTILITGINGFLGSHLAKRMATDYNIIGLEYSLENLFRLNGHSFKVFKSDTLNVEHIFSNYKVDIIIHTATFYGRSNEEVKQVAETNLFMPFNLLDAAINARVSAFINTDTVLDRFSSIYALTKRQFQEWLYIRSTEIQAVNMQLEHFYGPGCNDTNFITTMINRLSKNESNIPLTKGDQQRDFVYYLDVIDAYELIINRLNQLKSSFVNFEVCTGDLISIKQILQKLKELTQSSSHLEFGALPYRENELMISTTNNSELINLGWTPKTSIAEGLQKTVGSIVNKVNNN